MKSINLGILLAAVNLFSGAAHATTSVKDMTVASGFDYDMERQVLLDIQVLDHEGMPAAFRLVEVFDPTGGKQRILSGMTDEYGVFQGSVTLADRFDQVFVRANVLGIDNEEMLPIQNLSVQYTLQ
jgi:hypothetical protein